MNKCLLSCLLFLLAFGGAQSLPKSWKKCKRNDPSIDKCLQEAIQIAVADLADGDRSLGVLPLDPLKFNQLEVNQGSGPVAINLTFFDIEQNGFGSSIVDNVKSNFDKGQLDFRLKAQVPFVNIGRYKINGQILVLPIQGEGDCNLTMSDLVGDFSMKLKEVERAGKKHYEVTDMKLNLDMSRFYIHLDGLFNGDKALGDNMNLFLNENSKEIIKEVMPAISRGFGEGYKQIVNGIFSKVPIEKMFIE